MPAPYCHDQQLQPIICLKYPYHDPTTGLTFSAGTRFVYIPTQLHHHTYTVYALDPLTLHAITITIPKSFAYVEGQHYLPEDQITLFLHILKEWAHPTIGNIPYVWGGCSYKECTNKSFIKIDNGMITYDRPDLKHDPLTGFDCTGLIARAAQLASMPYYSKNSSTVLHNLQELSDNEHPRNGDLIWFPGHVMVISDVRHNLVIEAAGYDSGHGKVHETSISNSFEGISSYADLVAAFKAKKSLKRLNSNLEVFQVIPLFKILSIRSIY